MQLLFRISRWVINIIGILSLISWLISVGFKITWSPFNWNDINSIQFVIGAGLLVLYFVLGGFQIIFRSARILRTIISIIFTVIGIISLILSSYNSGIWLTNNNAWSNYKNIRFGILHICIFSTSITLISSCILFGSWIGFSNYKQRKNNTY